jgi:hypothetical protein
MKKAQLAPAANPLNECDSLTVEISRLHSKSPDRVLSAMAF